MQFKALMFIKTTGSSHGVDGIKNVYPDREKKMMSIECSKMERL